MFQKYNIKNLFLAEISVMYPDTDIAEVSLGGIFEERTTGYGYVTILAKVKGRYIDLQNMSKTISTTRNPKIESNVIRYIEPLSNYYTQEGKKLFKNEAINIAKNNYNKMLKNKREQMSKQNIK